jgi:hypothetical protein
MGLGKTLQVIALLVAERSAGTKGPTLIVCPTALLAHWQEQARRSSCPLWGSALTGRLQLRVHVRPDVLRLYVYHGSSRCKCVIHTSTNAHTHAVFPAMPTLWPTTTWC